MLARARELGFLGPGPLFPQIEHAAGFGDVWTSEAGNRPPARGADLGSGGGVPGLVLARMWPATPFLLVEAMARRAEFLIWAAAELNLPLITVAQDRAEVVAREPAHRGRFDLVTARGFGPPAVTAECAAGLLEPGGCLVVSEPPEHGRPRWPAEGLAALGMGRPSEHEARGRHYVVISQVEPCPQRYPRRVGVPGKRPLF